MNEAQAEVKIILVICKQNIEWMKKVNQIVSKEREKKNNGWNLH
jgi:hypothetical protein